jgi:homoserine kinase
MLHEGHDEDALTSLQDLLIEPHREALLPAYRACQEAALAAGALAGGISGSGPSSFWVCLTSEAAVRVAAALRAVMNANNQPCRVYTTPISVRGACVVSKSWQG